MTIANNLAMMIVINAFAMKIVLVIAQVATTNMIIAIWKVAIIAIAKKIAIAIKIAFAIAIKKKNAVFGVKKKSST